MVVSFPRAVRALLEVHARTAINAGLRNAGLALTGLAFLGALALWALIVLPLIVIAPVLGASLVKDEAALGIGSGVVFTLAPLFGALLSLMTGDGQELDLEKLEPYPAPPRALFAAELVASFVHPMMAVVAGVQLAFAAGVWVGGGPRLATGCALVTGLTLQAATRSLLASLAERAVRRAQGILVFALAGLPVLLLGLIRRFGEVQVDESAARAAGVLRLLPGALQVAAPARWEAGAFLEAAAALGGPLVAALLALALALEVSGRVPERAARVAHRPERLWTFSHPVLGVARLQLSALWASELGRFTLFLPLFWMLFLPLSGSEPRLAARPDLAAVFIWALLPMMASTFTLNQFGLDRGAVKALFLLPLSDVQVLLGKALALGLVLAVQAAIAAVLVAVFVPQPVAFLVAGPAMTLLIGGLQLLVGQWFSLAWPRPIPRGGLKQPPGSLVVGLVTIATLFATVLPLGALWWWLGGQSAWLLALTLLGGLALVAALFRVFTGLAAHALAARREHLVESLS